MPSRARLRILTLSGLVFLFALTLWEPDVRAGDGRALQQRYQLVLVARQAAEHCSWVEADTRSLLPRTGSGGRNKVLSHREGFGGLAHYSPRPRFLPAGAGSSGNLATCP